MNKELAQYVLANQGYNWALSDVEEACEFLDHPELKPEDTYNYHKWAEPYPRRCYCSAIGYTNKGRFYACHMSEGILLRLRLFNRLIGWCCIAVALAPNGGI